MTGDTYCTGRQTTTKPDSITLQCMGNDFHIDRFRLVERRKDRWVNEMFLEQDWTYFVFAQFFWFTKSRIDQSLYVSFQSFIKALEHGTTTG